MSTHQEVWITLRIKSQLPVEQDAPNFAAWLAKALHDYDPIYNKLPAEFLIDSHAVEVLEVKEELHIYGTEE